MKVRINQFGSGLPLVFFHGWGFDSTIWHSLIPHLVHQFKLYFVDLPGFGHSSLMEWGSFKEKLLSELPQQFAVVGWSLGGLFATRLAIEAPQRVNYLMNVSSSPYFLIDKEWPGLSPEVLARFYHRLSVDVKTTLEEFIALQSNNQFAYPISSISSREGLELGLDILKQWDLRAALKDFQIPACYLFGRLDPIVPFRLMHVMQKLYPQMTYVGIKKAAHMPFLSHQDLFLEQINKLAL